jgi:uncharacterized membrane protein
MAALHSACLLVHLVCLAIYGASGFGGLLLDRALWAAVERGRDDEALAFARTAMMQGRLAQFAAIFTLLTGVGMLASTNFVQWGQHWLYGKLVLFVALAGYGGAVGGRAGKKLMALLEKRAATGGEKKPVDGELAALRSTFATFHRVMLGMLVAVLALVALRP